MKILSVSNLSLWMWGEGKGIPSVFFPHREFARQGHEVTFLCPQKQGEPVHESVEGIHVCRFDFPFNFRAQITYFQTKTLLGRVRASVCYNLNWLFFQFTAFLKGFKSAKTVGPDIVYAHSLTAVLPAWLVSRLCKAKLVVRVYGTRQLYWRRKSLFWRIKECRDYLMFKVPAEYFIVTDDGNHGDLLARDLGVAPDKIRSWRNGIDGDLFSSGPQPRGRICDQYEVDRQAKIILSTARLIPDYGVDKLLRSCAEIFVQDQDSVCLIAGSGPEEERLRALAEELKISSRVRFLGVVSRETVKQLLWTTDIFVLMSRYHNCTNTLWEAMATGSCIVTTTNNAVQEVLTSGKNAVLIEDSTEELAGALEDLLSWDEERSRLGHNAKQRAAEVLESWPRRAEKELRLLESLIEETR